MMAMGFHRAHTSCQTVTKKIDEKISEEETQLSKWLNRSEEDLKVEFGKPDKINFKANSRNRFYRARKSRGVREGNNR